MPAAWISAGVGVLGALNSSSGGGSSSGGSQVAQGAANVAGGALSAQEAQQFGNQLAQTANPFGQYNQQFSQYLAGSAGQGNSPYGNPWAVQNSQLNSMANAGPAQAQTALQNQGAFTSQSQGLTGALNGQQYGQQINDLVQNPSSVFNTPQYQAAFGQGQSAVNSTLAAQGLNGSGNQLAALQSYGQTFGQNAYNTQLSQLSGLYGQALGANQQQYGQEAQNTQTGLAVNQQAFNQQATLQQMNQSQNSQSFNQLAQLSGLSSGSPTAAAAAQAQVYGNVNSAYQNVGQGIGQLASGAGNILNGLGSGSSTTSGVNTFGFNSGLGTTTQATGSADITGSGALFGTSAGIDTSGFTMGGTGNTWGF
jgi:hypothetical protein